MIVIVLIAANLVVFGQVIRHDFVRFDDPAYVTENPYIARGLTVSGISWAFTSLSGETGSAGYTGNWHPMTWLSHMVDIQLFGLNPAGHHGMSLAFHIANSILLFFILYEFTAAIAPSAFVAALFALHPAHIESMAWVAERKDVLSTLLWLLTLMAYGRYVRNRQTAGYGLVLGLFALGLMAKPMLVTLPFTLLLLDYWPLRRARLEVGQIGVWAGLIREKLPLVAIALVSSVITYLAQQSGGAVQSLGGFPLKVRIYNALVSYVAYIGKMFWPSGLAAYYQYRVLPHLQILLCLLLLLVVTAAAVRWARRFPYVLFGWLWYVGTLVPVIGLVQVGSQSMADRYTYVPFIGLFIAAAWAATDLVSRFRNLTIPTAIAGGLIVCALAMVSWRQVQYWKDGITLWQRALEIDSGNQTAHQNLAYDLWRAGRLDEAATHYREALRISPNFAIAHANLGLVLSDQGQFDEAIEHYEKALQLNVPKTPFQQIHTNLGIAYAKKNQDDKALPHYEEALRFDPSYAVAHLSIGNVYARQGKTADAIKEYKEALRLQPGLAVAQQNIDNLSRMSASPEALYKSAMSLAAQGKMDEAAAQLREALKLAPDYAEAHADLGTVLGNQGKLDEAITHFREAVRLKPDYGPAKANLEKALKLVEKNK